MLRMLRRIKKWEKSYEERRKLAFIEDTNQYVTCRQFKVWRRGAILAFVLLAVGGIGNQYADRQRSEQARSALVKSGQIVSVDGCNRDFRITQRERAVFERSLALAKQQHDSGLTTDRQYLRSREFFEQQLSDFALPDCRITQGLLTADPERADQPVPRPLYHGSPEENVIVFDPKPHG
jgi:hypothetical protein